MVTKNTQIRTYVTRNAKINHVSVKKSSIFYHNLHTIYTNATQPLSLLHNLQNGFSSAIHRNDMLHSSGETIQVNAVFRIVFECITIHCHVSIFDWILVKGHFIWEYGF